MVEPELIEIIEGPTPEFRQTAHMWSQSLYEGPEANDVVMCQLRTATGGDIQARSERAWQEGRPVRLDFPDEWGMRQQLDVVALRLSEVQEGEMLTIWVNVPADFDDLDDEDEDYEDDDDEDGFFLD